MSYEELSAHAMVIYDKAIERALKERGLYQDSDGTIRSTYESRVPQETLQGLIDMVYADFTDVPSMFEDFTVLPDPADFTPLVESVEGAMGQLSSGQEGVQDPVTGNLFPYNVALTDMTTAAGYLDEWDGLAVMEFLENFATPFPERVLNQFAAASVLANALRAEAAIWEAARKDIDKIAHDTIAALDHIGDCGKNEWTMAFTVVGAVVAVGAVTVASGGTAAVALAAVGAAATVGGAAAGQIEDPPELPLSGETAKAVVDSARSAIAELKTHIEAAEQKVQAACQQANATLLADGGLNYVAPKPALLDQDRPDVGRPGRD